MIVFYILFLLCCTDVCFQTAISFPGKSVCLLRLVTWSREKIDPTSSSMLEYVVHVNHGIQLPYLPVLISPPGFAFQCKSGCWRRPLTCCQAMHPSLTMMYYDITSSNRVNLVDPVVSMYIRAKLMGVAMIVRGARHSEPEHVHIESKWRLTMTLQLNRMH